MAAVLASKSGGTLSCAICLSDIVDGAIFVTPCKHAFHAACIPAAGFAACPCCRAPWVLCKGPPSPSPSPPSPPPLNVEDLIAGLPVPGVFRAGLASVPTLEPVVEVLPRFVVVGADQDVFEALLRVGSVGAAAAAGGEADELPPINLYIAADVSGSMRGAKHTSMLRAIAFAVGELSPRDSLMIVAFTSVAHVVFEESPVANTGSELVSRVLAVLPAAEGGTNSVAALASLALGMERHAPRNPHLIMITDGNDVGGGDEEEEEGVEGEGGVPSHVPLYTMGVGSDAAPDRLQELAAAHGCPYTFIEGPDAIVDVISACFSRILGRRTSSVHLHIMPSTAPGVGLPELRSEHPIESQRVALGELAHGDVRNVIVRVPLLRGSTAGAQVQDAEVKTVVGFSWRLSLETPHYGEGDPVTTRGDVYIHRGHVSLEAPPQNAAALAEVSTNLDAVVSMRAATEAIAAGHLERGMTQLADFRERSAARGTGNTASDRTVARVMRSVTEGDSSSAMARMYSQTSALTTGVDFSGHITPPSKRARTSGGGAGGGGAGGGAGF